MATPTEDLEQKINLVLENIKLKRLEKTLHLWLEHTRKKAIKLEEEKKKLRLFGVGARGAFGISLLGAAIFGAFYSYMPDFLSAHSKDEKVAVEETIKKQELAVSIPEKRDALPISAEPNLSPSLETITQFKFENPFTIDEFNNGEIYVFDAGNRTIHKFYPSGHMEGHYGNGVNNEKSTILRYVKHFTPEKRRRGIVPLVFPLRANEIQIDYLDGTIVTYDMDYLHFLKRSPKTEALRKISGAHCTAILHDILQEYGVHTGLDGNLIDDFIKTPNEELFDGICDDYVQDAKDGIYQEVVEEILQNESHHIDVVVAGPDPIPLDYIDLITDSHLQAYLRKLNRAVTERYYREYRYGPDDFNDAPRPTLGNDAPVEVEEDFRAFSEGLRYFIAKEIVRKNAFNLFQLNDKPSERQVIFSAVLPLYERQFEDEALPSNRGSCGLLPVIAFHGAEKAVIFGYVCHDGSIEEHQRISYDSTGATIIDYAQYKNKVYFIEKGHPHVSVIEVKNGH